MRRLLAIALAIGTLCLISTAISIAQDQGVTIPSISVDFGPQGDAEETSSTLQLLALLTVLSLAPAILILTTAFTRIVIVMSFVRTALGTQNIPPNQILIGLSLFLTFFVMAPTWDQINRDAIQPYTQAENPISFEEAVERAQKPLKDFMLANTYEKDLKMFMDMRGERAASRDDVSFVTLVPAFVVSELKTAFIIGFYIFVPFIIIDLIVASLLMGMGMMMMPPVVVSLPAKILVFVLSDGWSVITRAILSGYS